MSSFTTKGLRVTFTLSNGATFPGDPNKAANTLQLVGLRTVAVITAKGAPAFPQAEIAVFGMAQADMNSLSALAFKPEGVNRNVVQIEANDDVTNSGGWAAVYGGQIITAWIDYSGAPEVCLRVSAQVGFFDQINPATPTSYTAPAAVATIVSNIANKMNFAFENNGVTTVTSGPVYYPGVLTEQLRDVTSHYGIDWYMDTSALVQTLAICPKGAPRKLPTFSLSPTSGLVGYPVTDSRGYLRVKALYNPAFRFGGPLTITGSDVVIDSQLGSKTTLNSRANGNWMIGQLSHTLEAIKPGGAWFSDMLLYPPDSEPPQQ